LVQVLSVHDEAAAEHSEATGQLAERLARALGFDEDMVARCGLGARLHDIGKIAISRRILTKPAELVAVERHDMCLHPEKADEVLAAIPMLSHIAPIVRAHHERMDGRGYPDRLIGEEIPIESRVIAVVDAFHEMTVPRPYRAAVPVETALLEVLQSRGSHFDDDVALAFASLLDPSRRARQISA
jgi:putative nucleotidyltransferase with HDIG domain